jgi:NAD(P)-dependent dehydrogenase (short-subunit alcohol dehydrogenase family)
MTSAPAAEAATVLSRLPDPRTAVVTGAGGPAGIGRVTARILAESGWHVALVDINADGLAGVEKELREGGHENLLAVLTNIASESSVTEAYERIDSELPPVVGLVNLAGIACPVPLHECSLDEFERVMAVNVTGSYLMLKAAAARMIPQGVGRIVNTSSITAFDGGGTFSKGVYATAKAAVIGMCKGGARELGPYGITVNVIAPGPIDTEIMGGRLTDERKASMSAGIPLGRVGQPDEIGATVGFLLSEGGGYINGATIQVDGGKHMH